MTIKKIRYLLPLLLLLNFITASAQEDAAFKFSRTIPGNFTYFNIDNLDNLYLLNPNDQLKKLNSRGDSVAVFNDVKRYGKLYSIDVTNPLKILLYYKNYSTVAVLDRQLNNRNSIDFRKQNIFRVKALATSYDNNIWIFDEQDLKLKKIDEQGKVLLETVDCRQLFDSVPSPEQIIDRDGFVYLYDPAKGFYIFDYYGSFKNKLPFTGWDNADASGTTVFGFKGKKFFSYEQGSLNLKEYTLPAFFGKYNSIKAMNGNIYLLKENGIDMYKIK
ncbi:MAG: hypothetical protein ABJA78_03760 [Ferruginibacter sp.]